MIVRLFLFLLAYTALVAGAGGLAWKAAKPRLLPWLRERQLQRLGEERALLMLQAPQSKRSCYICDNEVDPEVDVFDSTTGWFHQTCYHALLRG